MENNNIIIYTASDGKVQLDVRLENDSVWLTQRQIADLLGTEVPAISKHISNIYESGELDMTSTLSKMEIVRTEGKRTVARELEHFNLDMVISVGYRVNSLRYAISYMGKWCVERVLNQRLRNQRKASSRRTSPVG